MNVKIIKKVIKNPNIKVRPTGEVLLTVPLETSDEYIEKLLIKRDSWIKEQLEFFKKNFVVAKEKNYISGDSVKYLGRSYRLKVMASKEEKVTFYRGYIYIHTEKIEDRDCKKLLLETWYRKRCEIIFNEIVQKYVKTLNLSLDKVGIRDMRTRWGSCNYEKRKINLNTKLIEKSKYCIEYVVLHELAHLKYPNHGKRFYNYLLTHMPDYEWRKERLEENE